VKPYADLIGAKYVVVADNLFAYGIYQSMDERSTIGMIDLVPLNIGGNEIAFRRTVAKGQVITILRDARTHTARHQQYRDALMCCFIRRLDHCTGGPITKCRQAADRPLKCVRQRA
jgi:hypothetical protein